MFTNRLLMKLASIMLLIFVSGCATKGETYKFYSGENRSATELALLIPFHETTMVPIGRIDVYIIEIDGKMTEHYNLSLPTYEILPGEHKIRLGFLLISNGKEARGVDPHYMVFTAKAGHTYITKGNFPKYISEGQAVISFWLEDVKTKQVLTGTRPIQAN